MDKKANQGEQIKEESKLITRGLLERAIGLKEKRHIKVTNFSIKGGGALGTGYTSVTFKVTVKCEIDGDEKIHNLFIKVAHNNKVIQQLVLGECKLFVKEKMAYSRIITDMIRYQMERGLEPFGPSVPPFYYGVVDDNSGIIMLRNIECEGFTLANKRVALNYEQCKLVMKELAIFHALSFAIKHEHNRNLSKYEYLFHESTLPPKSFMIKNLQTAVQIVERVSNDTEIQTRVKGLLDLDLEKTLRDLLKPVEPFALICHGDVWCNNLLFKYPHSTENEKPLHVTLVDLQVVRYALPTTDLSYFFYSSTTKSTREKHLGSLLRLYHSTFEESLEKLGLSFPEFNFDVLERLFKESTMFGVLFLCMYLSGLLAEPSDLHSTKTEGDLDDTAVEHCRQMESSPENILIIKERLIGAIEDAVELGAL